MRPSTASTVLTAGTATEGCRHDQRRPRHPLQRRRRSDPGDLAKVLRTRSVDAGGGWLIFALPPAEIAVHPADDGGRAELYLMCDDVAATVGALRAEGIEITRPISDQGWGLLTAIALPGGVELGLYQPRHPTAAQPT